MRILFVAVALAASPGLLAAQTPDDPLRGLRAPDSADRQWKPPDLRIYSQALQAVEPVSIDPNKEYELLELIDMAERVSPKTRIAWEQARAAAAHVGIAESEYYPLLALKASGMWVDLPLAAQTTFLPSPTFDFETQAFTAMGVLEYTLLDFGRRKAVVTGAKERLMATNLGFNFEHQRVIFSVQTAFYALSAARGQIAVAQSGLAAASNVSEATEARLNRGLATVTDVALAQQQAVLAEFDLAEATAHESDAYVALAESIGIPLTTPIRVADFSHLDLPTTLSETVEAYIDRALQNRPDLLARVAMVRESENAIQRAQADFYPTLKLGAEGGVLSGRYRVNFANEPAGQWVPINAPAWSVGLSLLFPLFDGGLRRERVELARANYAAAESELKDSRDAALSRVWKSYTNAKLALQRIDVARALVAASDKAYQGTLEAYRHGLATLIDLLGARRAADRARQTELETKTAVLEAYAALAFSTGDTGSEPANRGSAH